MMISVREIHSNKDDHNFVRMKLQVIFEQSHQVKKHPLYFHQGIHQVWRRGHQTLSDLEYFGGPLHEATTSTKIP